MNALRANFYEYGVVFPADMNQTTRMTAWLAEHGASLPKLLADECTDILALIDKLTDRITAKTKLLASLASESETARRLQTMPGVGPMTALAVEAFAPNMQEFRSGRDFAAWLGLVPKQHSSGGKERLGRVSKAGQTYSRRLLIIGAMSRVIGRGARNVVAQSWLGRLIHRKPKMLAAIALANKMTRQLWAMLTNNVDYHDPAMRASARPCTSRALPPMVRRPTRKSPPSAPRRRDPASQRCSEVMARGAADRGNASRTPTGQAKQPIGKG
jgi:transposase